MGDVDTHDVTTHRLRGLSFQGYWIANLSWILLREVLERFLVLCFISASVKSVVARKSHIQMEPCLKIDYNGFKWYVQHKSTLDPSPDRTKPLPHRQCA